MCPLVLCYHSQCFIEFLYKSNMSWLYSYSTVRYVKDFELLKFCYKYTRVVAFINVFSFVIIVDILMLILLILSN